MCPYRPNVFVSKCNFSPDYEKIMLKKRHSTSICLLWVVLIQNFEQYPIVVEKIAKKSSEALSVESD